MPRFTKRDLIKAGIAGMAGSDLLLGISPMSMGAITAVAQTPKRGGVG